jgi:hypothetical protein
MPIFIVFLTVGTGSSYGEQMGTQISVSKKQNIRNKIYMIRGMQVMLDRDLAELSS